MSCQQLPHKWTVTLSILFYGTHQGKRIRNVRSFFCDCHFLLRTSYLLPVKFTVIDSSPLRCNFIGHFRKSLPHYPRQPSHPFLNLFSFGTKKDEGSDSVTGKDFVSWFEIVHFKKPTFVSANEPGWVLSLVHNSPFTVPRNVFGSCLFIVPDIFVHQFCQDL